MKTPFRKLKTAIVPIGNDGSGETALNLAAAIASEVVLVGVVPIKKGESVSAGATEARSVRKRLMELSNGPRIRFKSTIIVSEEPWVDLMDVITHEKPELMVVEWKDEKSVGICPWDQFFPIHWSMSWSFAVVHRSSMRRPWLPFAEVHMVNWR